MHIILSKINLFVIQLIPLCSIFISHENTVFKLILNLIKIIRNLNYYLISLNTFLSIFYKFSDYSYYTSDFEKDKYFFLLLSL